MTAIATRNGILKNKINIFFFFKLTKDVYFKIDKIVKSRLHPFLTNYVNSAEYMYICS